MSLRNEETTVTASVLLVFKTARGGRFCVFKPATSSFFTAQKKKRKIVFTETNFKKTEERSRRNDR